MEPGHWFVSLYNDDGDEQGITFYAAVAEDMTQNCPNGCSGNGQCLLGHCQCNPGFGGDDCSESKCYLTIIYIIYPLYIYLYIHRYMRIFIAYIAYGYALLKRKIGFFTNK